MDLPNIRVSCGGDSMNIQCQEQHLAMEPQQKGRNTRTHLRTRGAQQPLIIAKNKATTRTCALQSLCPTWRKWRNYVRSEFLRREQIPRVFLRCRGKMKT